MYATHASVVIVKPAGTSPGPRIRVISATLAPLPPSRARMSCAPSVKSYTQRVATSVGTLTLLHQPCDAGHERVEGDVRVGAVGAEPQ